MVIKILTDSKPKKYVETNGLTTFAFVFIGVLTLLPQIGMAIARIVENGGLGFNKTEDFICVGWTITILYQILLLVLVARSSSKINHLQHALIDTQRWAWDVNERIEALETAE
jgi:hypothetical protein